MLALAGGAHAQDVLAGPPPAAGETPDTSPAKPVVQEPTPPDQAAPETPAEPKPAPTPAPPALHWQPYQTAILQALDKVDGQTKTLEIPVGSRQTYRNLTVAVQSCYARAPDQPPDATAYLVISDAAAATPSFTGWMLAAEPAASTMEHPVYDIRVLGCR